MILTAAFGGRLLDTLQPSDAGQKGRAREDPAEQKENLEAWVSKVPLCSLACKDRMSL